MRNQNGGELGGRLNVIFIDLLTIKQLVGTPAQSLTPLQKWGLYLSYADDESRRDYISQIAQSEEGIMEADRIARTMSEEDANWFRQNSIQMFWEDYYAEKEASIEQSLEKGREEGAQQNAKETAKNFLRMNVLTHEQIAQGTGLPLEQVQELAEKVAAEPAPAQA